MHLQLRMNSSVNSTCVILLLTLLSSLAILSVDMASTQPIIAQLDNSTNIEEEKSFNRSINTVNTTFILLFSIVFISIGIALRKKKRKIRMVLALLIVFVSFSTFILSSPDRRSNDTNEGYRTLAILLLIIALITAFIPTGYRTKRPTMAKT